MNIRPLFTPEFASIERTLAAHPRLHGYYLVKLVTLDPPLVDARSESGLDAVLQFLDDTPWKTLPPHLRHSWSGYRVLADEARSEVVNALVGGRDVGHTHDTVERHLAETLWETMEGHFGQPRDYYIRLGFGNSEYVYQRGAVIIDSARAGIVFVVESD